MILSDNDLSVFVTSIFHDNIFLNIAIKLIYFAINIMEG